MVAFKYCLGMLGLVMGVSAQGQFGVPENSAAVLAALKQVDNSTRRSAQAAQLYRANIPSLQTNLENANIFLRADWQTVIFTAQSSAGFYSNGGAQAIIDYINNVLFPDTRAANKIYASKRDLFVQTGFAGFINNGLLQLRTAVDAASAAVQSKTRAKQLSAITVAFTQIEVDYAQVQELQQFGSAGGYY